MAEDKKFKITNKNFFLRTDVATRTNILYEDFRRFLCLIETDDFKGEDAYEIAVELGFIGTREEWLESLVGEQGKQGEPGEPGQIGLISFYINENMELISINSEIEKFEFQLSENKELIIV